MYQYFHQGAVGDILLFPMAIVEDVIHRCGAFGVARFVRHGNAKAMIRGTGDRLGSTLFVLYSMRLRNVAIGAYATMMVFKMRF